MAHMNRAATLGIVLVLALVCLPTVVHAFGAGNIQSVSRIEGQNWRHGDIEDTLLTLLMSRAAGGKKFSKMDVKRVYFGNWLRDYSQAVDVGTVKSVSAEAIRIILWVLGFLSFGYGTKEFEVTRDRLGCYRPEEHIDNPKDYADNLDARKYDPRLRGPVDERRELAIDPHTGLKMYIASEDQGITTSAGLVRNLFGRCIFLGRQYARTHNSADLYEALRLLGTGCHCLEDFSAHSNYCELALRNLGANDVFPHVGGRTMVRVKGVNHPIFPIVTGTFGGVDFLHSVMGELSDKVSQSEVQELEGTIQESDEQNNVSYIKELLSKLPSGLLGSDQAGKADQLEQDSQAARLNNMNITPRHPEAWTQELDAISQQIYPILEFHDQLMQQITEAIEKIPVLPALIEQVQEQISIFVFSLLAPLVLPVIKQVKNELATGSASIIASSREKQHIVFRDDSCSDPTHSMLSKDHFSNVLNEPAGRVASAVLKWAVPQLIACWDDDRIDVDRTLNRIIHGVFHHPALREEGDDGARDGRQIMFHTMAEWWQSKPPREQASLRQQLSRAGVESGQNHKEGVHDTGHGCGKPLARPGKIPQPGQLPIGSSSHISSMASQAVGGGAVGGLVGALAGGLGSVVLGSSGPSGPSPHGQNYGAQSHNQGPSYGQQIYDQPPMHSQFQGQAYGQPAEMPGSYVQPAEMPGSYGQPEYGQPNLPPSDTQHGLAYAAAGTAYGHHETTKPNFGGPGVLPGQMGGPAAYGQQQQQQRHGHGESEGGDRRDKRHSRRNSRDDDESDDSNDSDDYEKKQRKRANKERKRREKEERKHGAGGGGGGGGSDEWQQYPGMHSHAPDRREDLAGGRVDGYGRRPEYGAPSGYGQQNQYGGPPPAQPEFGGGAPGGYGGDYGGGQEYGGGGGYGRREEYGGGQGYGGRQEYGGGGRSQEVGDGNLAYGEQGREPYGEEGREPTDGREGGGYGRRDDGYGGQSAGDYGGRY